MISIQAALHIALTVSDLALSEAFYGKVLGLTPVDRPLAFPGTWYQVGTFQIHLIVAAGDVKNLQNPDKWGRNPHLAFAVEDLEAARNALRQANCPLQESASGRPALFTQDPDGHVIELSQA